MALVQWRCAMWVAAWAIVCSYEAALFYLNDGSLGGCFHTGQAHVARGFLALCTFRQDHELPVVGKEALKPIQAPGTAIGARDPAAGSTVVPASAQAELRRTEHAVVHIAVRHPARTLARICRCVVQMPLQRRAPRRACKQLGDRPPSQPVSYTHLTLPTILLV